MLAPLEDDLIVKLNRDSLERDLKQLHRKLDEFEQRLGDYFPVVGAALKLRCEAAPLPMRT
jgi:hypothetical protein